MTKLHDEFRPVERVVFRPNSEVSACNFVPENRFLLFSLMPPDKFQDGTPHYSRPRLSTLFPIYNLPNDFRQFALLKASLTS